MANNNCVQLTNVLLTLSSLLISFSLSLHLEPQLDGQIGITIVKNGQKLDSNSNFQSNAPVVVAPRQDDEEDDENEDTERQQVVSGVGNIITGAFSLDPVKILKGAFGFADKDVQENILNVILGQAPPSQAKATTTQATLVEEIQTTLEQELLEMEPEPELKVNKATTKVTEKPQVIIRNFRNRTTTTQPTTPSTKKPRAKKTTRAQQRPGEEDDEEYGDK